MNAKEYIKYLLSVEDYSFSLEEIARETDGNSTSLKFELLRLAEKGEIINLRKGFYLIIPPRFSSIQKLPIQLYCEKLFRYLDRNYYIALFSAAKFHGAGHQQVQRDYVVTEGPKFKDISKNNIDIRFFTTTNSADRSIQTKKSDAGTYKVSNPALTIVDLIHYQTKLGGINRILANIEELSEELNESDLVELLKWYPNKSTLQRFGFLLEELGIMKDLQELIFMDLKKTSFFPVLLSPKSNEKPGAVNNRWKVVINTTLERDL
ncbi:type IV toxin-antitoxin system AbiEi family antitoxin [Saccharicrinis sp. FJH54]|uniref:type IV toxin-antitoxin system AbiEi family antitoxin domain-containing protein n=1 Tax=Saccharicrinis sp. FJH54 TaxID=3344665 RepID=UPI0035D46240